jgi:hypothetical protein
MADTRKEKLQAMLDAIEASKSEMGKQQLMEVLRKKQPPKQSIVPDDMRKDPKAGMVPLPHFQKEGEKPQIKKLPHYGDGSDAVVVPLSGNTAKQKSRLYRMMQ